MRKPAWYKPLAPEQLTLLTDDMTQAVADAAARVERLVFREDGTMRLEPDTFPYRVRLTAMERQEYAHTLALAAIQAYQNIMCDPARVTAREAKPS